MDASGDGRSTGNSARERERFRSKGRAFGGRPFSFFRSWSGCRLVRCGFLSLILAGPVLLSGCDHRLGVRPENLRPFVELFPPPADRVPYITMFRWSGWDSDGVIDRYEYALDVPESVPLDRLDDPADTSVVWTPTTAHEMWFTFSTTVTDTIRTPAGVEVLPVDIGPHCLYLRSVDNEGAVSAVSFQCFTAQNVHPRSQIDLSRCGHGGGFSGSVGTRFVLRWSGVDPDSPDPEKRPAHYEWKPIPVPGSLVPPSPVPSEDLTRYVLGDPGPAISWNRTDADTAILTLETPRNYIIALRAVDQNGGTESRFVGGRNALRLKALSSNSSAPVLIARDRALGTFTFPGYPPRFPGESLPLPETPLGLDLNFDLTAGISAYCAGGTVEYDWGVDVADVDHDPGFNGWSTTPLAGPIRFTQAGTHTIVIKARDNIGGVTIGTIVVNVIAVPRDREVLYVDDYRLSRLGSVSDAMMDARVYAMLDAAGVPASDVHTFNVWGDADLGLEPRLPALSDLLRYRTVLWSSFGSGLGGSNALVESAVCGAQRTVQIHVMTGGSIWVYGDQVMGSFRQFGNACRVFLSYDETNGLNFDAGHFPCEFLKICGGDFREAKRNSAQNGLLRALPAPRAAGELFPPMDVDSTVFFQPGIPYVDAMFQPQFAGAGLDTLYTMRAPAANSSFNNKPVAFRYFDADPAAATGAVAIFGFSYHLLKPGSGPVRTGVHGMARSMMDWFRSRQRGGSP